MYQGTASAVPQTNHKIQKSIHAAQPRPIPRNASKLSSRAKRYSAESKDLHF